MAIDMINTFALPSPAAPYKLSATPCATSFTCPSFTCFPRAAWGAACVCWAWVLPLEDGGGYHDEHLHAPVFRGAQHAPATPCAMSFTCDAQKFEFELELEPIHHMAQKPVLRGEVGARALRVRSVSREEVWASAVVQGAWVSWCGYETD